LAGQRRCHGIGAGALVSEGEGLDNQQEAAGGRGEWGVNHVMELRGGIFIAIIKLSNFNHEYVVSHLEMYRTNVLLACLTQVRC
jgi:hypothetical protein